MSQFEQVSGKYGAPMGRPESHEGLDKPVRCFKVRMVDGCYDQGGAYWGGPDNIWCAQNDTFRVFTRASDRTAAKAQIKARFATIKWVN